jgi:hypothetical protein
MPLGQHALRLHAPPLLLMLVVLVLLLVVVGIHAIRSTRFACTRLRCC